jgi:transposase
MAGYFDDPTEYGDGAFITINFNEILPEHHPARLISRFIETIDLSSFEEKYNVGSGKSGRPPKSIRMMLGVLLYAIYSRFYSAHKIEKATYSYSDFWIFTHKNRISHDKISDFINVHEEEIIDVFLSTILLAEKNKLLDFGTLYQDGFLIKANASKQKSYTRKSLNHREKKLHAALEEVMEKLKNAEEDDDVNQRKKDVEKKLSTIKRLQEELNEEIQKRLNGKRDDKVDEEKVSINTTDRDSSLMRMKDSSYANAYLKITAVDSKADIVISSVVEGYFDESHRAVQLFRQSNKNCERLGVYDSVCFDSGFNTMGTCSWFEVLGVTVIAPTKDYENKRRNPDTTVVTFEYDEKSHTVRCSEGAVLYEEKRYVDPKKGTRLFHFGNKGACGTCSRLKECTTSSRGYRSVTVDSRHVIQKRALEKYKSETGQEIYAKRLHAAETFQGDLKNNGKFDRFYRRRKETVRTESILQDIVWNLRRIFNSKSTEILWT